MATMYNGIYSGARPAPTAFPTRPARNLASALPALDPSGLVPVNRTQPTAGTFDEVQRLTENRLGTMPPSSFSGAGAGFVPVDRPSAPINTLPVMATDHGPGPVSVGQQGYISGPAVRDVVNQQTLYGGGPTPTYANPAESQMNVAGLSNAVMRGTENRQDRRDAMMSRLEARLPPDVFARLQERLAQNDARRADMMSRFGAQAKPGPAYFGMSQDRVDQLRQALASRGIDINSIDPSRIPAALQPYYQGLLGTAA